MDKDKQRQEMGDMDSKSGGMKKLPLTVRPIIKPGIDASKQRRFDLFPYRDAPVPPSKSLTVKHPQKQTCSAQLAGSPVNLPRL